MPRWVNKTLEIVPFGIVLPFFLMAASVGPDEAVSNLAKWANKLGITQLPEWISKPRFDESAANWALAGAAIYAVYMWGVRPYLRGRAGDARSTSEASAELADRMTLKDAATELYNRAQAPTANHDFEYLVGFAEASMLNRPQGPDDVLDYMGVFIAQTHNVPLHGRRPPATVARDISRAEVKGYVVSDGAVNLRDKINNQIVFTDLTIRRADFAAFLMARFGPSRPVENC